MLRSCLLNRAACSLRLEQPEAVVEDCTRVLAAKPLPEELAKARYRRGQAFAPMGGVKLPEAAADLLVRHQAHVYDAPHQAQMSSMLPVCSFSLNL